MITLLCPTRARPQQCKRMIESAIATSEGKLEIYLNIERYGDEGYMLPEHDRVTYYITDSPAGLPTAHKWNMLAEEAMKNPENKLFMLAADDMVFSTPLWDGALVETYEKLDNKIHVFSLLDSRGENSYPHPIMTREWIGAMGYFIVPIFLHWHQDLWTTQIAKHNSCFTHLPEYLLIHDKCNDRGQPDATHSGIRQMQWRERDASVAKTCGHFLETEKQRLANIIARGKLCAA